MGAELSGNSYSTRSGLSLKGAVPSGRSPSNSVLVAGGSNGGSVGSICRTATQWRQPLPPRRISAFCWSGGGPKASPRFGTYSPRYAIAAIPGPSVIWRVSLRERAPVRVRTLDPMTGRVISPVTAAALCVKPRGQMTARQAANVDALKGASAEFTAMRRLAMRFRGLLRGGMVEELDAWLIDARASGIYAMQRFARTIRQDLEAVRNAVSEPWSNGQTEGQINKLKTLKRAVYGRAGVDLLRARMMPL